MPNTEDSDYKQGVYRSMAEPFRALNKRAHSESDRGYYWASWVVGVLAGLFILATVAAQIHLKGHP